MKVIGVTGSLGSGKSEVARMLGERGALILDADQIGHICLRSNQECIDAVAKAFGDDVFSYGKVDRSKLANIVFTKEAKRKKLMKILHPKIKEIILDEIEELKKNKRLALVVIDAPLLIEAKWQKIVDAVIVVSTTQEKQIKRVMKRSGLSKEEILNRIHIQMPANEKEKYADYVIENNLSIAVLNKKVNDVYESILSSKP